MHLKVAFYTGESLLTAKVLMFDFTGILSASSGLCSIGFCQEKLQVLK